MSKNHQSHSSLSEAEIAILKSCKPIAELDEATQNILFQSIQLTTTPASIEIIRQGDIGKLFFVLLEGQVEVLQIKNDNSEKSLAMLHPGSYFGEQSLLGNASGKASATVRSIKKCKLSASLILSGMAMVLIQTGKEHRELAHLGSGQLFGEKGVLENKPRAATIVAESELELLQIDADAFLKWHENHPKMAGFFNSLSQVYTLAEGRQLSVFMGEVAGASAVTTISGKPTEGVVSTRILNEGVVVFSNASAEALEGERASLVFSNEEITRELRVIVKERKKNKINSRSQFANNSH